MARSPVSRERPKAAVVPGWQAAWIMVLIGVVAICVNAPTQGTVFMAAAMVINVMREIEDQRRKREGWTDE